MKIDGKAIATDIFHKLHKQVLHLRKKNIIPHLAIVLIGDNPASVSYVTRKKIKAEEIGAKASVVHYAIGITNEELLAKIQELNNDPTIYGIIVQRPLPNHIDTEAINQAVLPKKDIDAFHKDSPFEMPLAKAVLLLLENVYRACHPELVSGSPMIDSHSGTGIKNKNAMTFLEWLQSKNIAVMGKGETGGGPIITLLKKSHVTPTVIDSKTTHTHDLLRQSDIIISAVGKEQVIRKEMLKKGVILISVGQHKQEDGKFHGDYEEKDVQDMASFYSPTPGGVGPANVACLLQNLLMATQIQTIRK